MLNFGITAPMPFFIAVPNVSLTCRNTTDFGVDAGRREDFLLVGEGVAEDHPRGREVAEHELVALLGDRRSGGDIDDEGNALLLGDLGDRAALAGIEGAHQKLRAVGDQLLGARARDLDVGLGVGVHDLEFGQADALEDRVRELDAAEAVLADAGLGAGARQQHADLERRALRADDRRGREHGRDGGGAGQQTAAVQRSMRCANSDMAHSPRIGLWRHGRGARPR